MYWPQNLWTVAHLCNITKQEKRICYLSYSMSCFTLLPLTGWLQELHPSAGVFGKWTHICLWDLRLWSPVCFYCKFACFHNYSDSSIVILLSWTGKNKCVVWWNVNVRKIWRVNICCVCTDCGRWTWQNKPVTLAWLRVFHLRFMTISVYLCTPLSLSYPHLHPIFAYFFSIKWQTVITFVCVLCLI